MTPTLPGPMIDLVTLGADLNDATNPRSAVVKATRSVMLSAHRHGIPYHHVHVLLTDTSRNKLADQISTGRGGRRIARAVVNKFLRDHWDQTAKVVANTQPIDADLARGFIEYVRDQVAGITMSDQRALVLNAALDLADHYGTIRPTLPVRVLATKAGLPTFQQAHRELMSLHKEGHWLVRARRGDQHRASLYWVAPGLLRTYMGAIAPTSEYPSTSDPSTSAAVESAREEVTAMEIVIRVAPEDSAEYLEALAKLNRDRARQARPQLRVLRADGEDR